MCVVYFFRQPKASWLLRIFLGRNTLKKLCLSFDKRAKLDLKSTNTLSTQISFLWGTGRIIDYLTVI